MTTILSWRPSPAAPAAPVAVLRSDGRLDHDPNFPRLLELHPTLRGEEDHPDVFALRRILGAFAREGLSPAGADPLDLASRLFPPGDSRLVRVISMIEVTSWNGDDRAALLELLPAAGEARDALLADLSARLRDLEAHLRPGLDAPDPFGRREEANPVALAAATARQADLASAALLRFARACRAAFGDSALLNEDGLPVRPEDLSLLVASRATVEADVPALREAARTMLAACPEDGQVIGEDFVQTFNAVREALRTQVDAAPPLPCTRRASSPGAEALLGRVFPVLDHGEVELVDYMGTDAQLCRIARVSTGSDREDLGLLGYLVRHRHNTPLEFGRLVLRVKAPWAVAQQWLRHRTGSFSVHSLRYQPPIREAYVPAPDHVQARPDGARVKQGRGADLDPTSAGLVATAIRTAQAEALGVYDALMSPSPGEDGVDPILGQVPARFSGVASELARLVLPQGQYTQFYWTTDAHNLMHFLRLRLDGHAQREFRSYGEAVLGIFEAWLPALAGAFRRYVLLARTFSEREFAVLGAMLAPNLSRILAAAEAEGEGFASVVGALMTGARLSAGERREFLEKLHALLPAGASLANAPGFPPFLRREGFVERASSASGALERDLDRSDPAR